MKRKVKVILDADKIFGGLIISDNNIETVFEIEETPENYRVLCNSEFIKKWSFIEDIDKERENNEWPLNINNYSTVQKDFLKNGINIKDLRDIIMVSYSYYCVSEMKTGEPKIKDVINYYLVNKESIKTKAYSEGLILSTIAALSETDNPLLDFLKRLEDTKVGNYNTFEEFYKKLYEPKK